jgi:excisionase family DNA binding protein
MLRPPLIMSPKVEVIRGFRTPAPAIFHHALPSGALGWNYGASPDRANATALTPQEVADQYGVCRKTVYRALWSGELVGSKIGGWRIREEDADAWYESGKPGRQTATHPIPRLRIPRASGHQSGSMKALLADECPSN